MPKAKCAFRRSNPFELRLCEAQDQCNIRAHTKFQLPKCRWSLMTMGQSWGILCSERVFVNLNLKLKVSINAHGLKKKKEPNQDDAPDHFLSAKRLHTRPTVGSNDRFLLLKPFIKARKTLHFLKLSEISLKFHLKFPEISLPFPGVWNFESLPAPP